MLITDPGFSANVYLHHCYTHSDWYESFSFRIPSSEFLRVVRRVLPFSWTLQPMGIWSHVSPPNWDSGKQGWKIHVSAKPENCLKILEQSVQVCLDCEVPFKFLSDPFIFHTFLSKGAARESSGKFITIYPLNESHFEKVAGALHEKFSEFEGPYILSDKPYRASQVVFYRYGAFWGYPQLSVYGHIETLLRSPSGELVHDGRSPFFNPPVWVSDPFDLGETEEDVSPGTQIYLKDGRYRIEQAIQFSLTGGVYRAIDLDSGKTVVIKEARPHTSVEPNGTDAIGRLEKEYRLLKKLSGTRITPEPIDLFFDWKHLFLVEEFLKGENLFTKIVALESDRVSPRIHTEALHLYWSNLAYAVKVAHDHNIIINDFSPGNVMIDEKENMFCLIDLESAWEEGVDDPVQGMGTVGYRAPWGVNNKSDDMYGLGTLLFSLVAPITPLLYLEAKAKHVFLDAAEREGCLSKDMKTLLLSCLDPDEKVRPTVSQLVNRFDNLSIETTSVLPEEGDFGISDVVLIETLNKTLSYIKSNMDLQRKDRLFPADPSVFMTNPLSVAHGASGVAYALSSIEGEVPDEVISWMLSQQISKDTYTPGLYLGLSGIAWVFWKLGLNEAALRLIKMAADHPLLWDLPDVFYGAAGFGITCLYFYAETDDAYWLEQASCVGDELIRRKVESDKGFYWPDITGNVWTGYARGASGISLFLLYLYLASGDRRFKEAGRTALDYDLGQAVDVDDTIRMPRATSDSLTSHHQETYPPYWADGTGGVCTTLLRYLSVFGEDSDKTMLEQLMPDVTSDHAAFPTLFTGLAGLANVHLDAFDFTGDTKYISSAFYVTKGLLRFQIEKPDGIAFPGEQLMRISTDFGSGSSGIALFLHRLRHREKHPGNFNFILDNLLCPTQ